MENREHFLEKLNKYGECVQAIGKEAQGILDPDTRSKLIELQRNIRELQERIKENQFEIAIVGLEKAGKSTFANALIGVNILPTKEERCTYTSSCVKYGDSTRAEVEFFTQEEFNQRFLSNLQELGADAHYTYGNFTESQLQQLIEGKSLTNELRNIKEDVSDMIHSYSEISYWLGQPPRKFLEYEMKSDEFKNLIQNPDRREGEKVQKPAFAVKAITIYSNNLVDMKNCLIYDIPGFDSPIAMHMEQTKAYMNLADVIILIANASKPSLTGPQVHVFGTGKDADDVSFNEKIFVFANRADESTNLDYNKNVLREDLAKYRILSANKSERLYFGSAFAYLAERGKITDEHALEAIEKLKRSGITSGIDQIKRGLQEYNDNVRTGILEKRVMNLETRIRDIIKTIEESIGGEDCGNYDGAEVRHIMESSREAEKAFDKSLNNYISEVESLLDDKPLTNEVLESLKTNLQPETLFPIPEDIEPLKKKFRHLVEKFESALREHQRRTIKDKIDNIISGKFEALVEKILVDLTNLLVESLGVSSEHRYYEEIRKLSSDYIDGYFSSFDFESIYQVLYLRFLSEVFEILIIQPFLSDDRLNCFNRNRENIISLAFYTKDVQERIKACSPIYPEDLPLINKILFHERTHNGVAEEEKLACINESVEIIRSRINSLKAPVQDYVENLIAWTLENKVPLKIFVDTLREVMLDIRAKNYAEEEERNAVKRYLNIVFDRLQPLIPTGITRKYIPLRDRYDTAKTLRVYEHDWVVEKFKDDITILTEVISESVVNAFRLELPFVVNVRDMIQKMIDDSKEKPFAEFYDKSYRKIEYAKFEEIEAIRQRNNEKQDILDKISKMKQYLS